MNGEINSAPMIPRILVIDDMLGRTLVGRPHEDRASFMRRFRVLDVTADGSELPDRATVSHPVASAFFCRGQRPSGAMQGDTVENDPVNTLKLIRSGWDQRPIESPPWAMVVLDMCFYTGRVTKSSESSDLRGHGMPEGRPADAFPENYFGLELLRMIRTACGPDLPVVVLSSMAPRQIEEQWVKGGATQFIQRDSEDAPAQFLEAIKRAGLYPDDKGEIVGNSLSVLKALRTARNLRPLEHILLLGETGVGKEMLARFIHRNTAGSRKRPFIIVNTPGIPKELLSSELFGHEKNAFTGANERRIGKFEQADGGDIFFDEIGYAFELLQGNLLRVLENGMFNRVGGNEERHVKVRFLAATDARVEDRLAGPLRNRISHEITLPPLRERPEDIPLLVDHMMNRLYSEGLFPTPKQIDPDVIDALQSYPWPGNIRQLHRVLLEACGGMYSAVPRLAWTHLPEVVRGKNNLINSAAVEPPEKKVSVGKAPMENQSASMTGSEHRNGILGRLSGSLPELQKNVVDYLIQALEETRDPVSGKLVPTQAYRLMLPEPERTVNKRQANLTIKGAGLFKKLLNIHPPTARRLMRENSTLLEASPWIETRGGSLKK